MLFPDVDEDTVFIHRGDEEELLGTFSKHAFKLDGYEWRTVEHYFQAMKFHESNPEHFKAIQACSNAKQARRLGRARFKSLRKDWGDVRRVIMTRALYTKCKTHENIAHALLETGEAKIMEASQYDYYWGCGRDRRAENTYGKVLMDVRKKLREEQTV